MSDDPIEIPDSEEEELLECDECGAEGLEEDFPIEGVCSACCGDCAECQDTVLLDFLEETIHGDSVCSLCRERFYFYSDAEGEWVHMDDSAMAEDTEAMVSTSYAESNWHLIRGEWYEHARGGDLLLEYNANPLNYFTWPSCQGDIKRLFYGVELEMETARGCDVEDLIYALGGEIVGGGFILKEDGSLSNGLELATRPMTLDQHREFWPRTLGADLKRVARSGMGTDRCGIHIHVNKRALSKLVISKIFTFLNSPMTSHLVATVAQRNWSDYAMVMKKKFVDGHKIDKHKYQRVNVKDWTVELRLFKGNIRPERVIKNVEFADALIHWALDTSIKDAESAESFTRWIQGKGKVYPCLTKYMTSQRLLPERQKKEKPACA